MARTIRKETRQPDTFISVSGKTIQWIQKYQKHIITCGATLLAVLAIFGGYRFWTSWVQSRASIAYSLGEGAQRQGRIAEAEQAFREAAIKYPNTRGGILARLQLATALRDQGKDEEAKKEYQILLKTVGTTPADQELAQRGLAAISVAGGNCDAAISIWREILAKGSQITPEDLYVSIASCHEKMGRRTETLKTYEELSQKFPQSPFLTPQIRERMTSHTGKNP